MPIISTPWNKGKEMASSKSVWDWRDGSVVKNLATIPEDWGFSAQHQQGSSQSPVNPSFGGILMPSTGFRRHCMHVVYGTDKMAIHTK